MKLKRKINLKKTIKRMRTKLEKITYHKLGLNNEIEKKLKFYKRSKEQKFEIKRKRTEVKYQLG